MGWAVSGPESCRAASSCLSRGSSWRQQLKGVAGAEQRRDCLSCRASGGSFPSSSCFFHSNSSLPAQRQPSRSLCGLWGGRCSGQWGAKALFLPGERAPGMVTGNRTPSIRPWGVCPPAAIIPLRGGAESRGHSAWLCSEVPVHSVAPSSRPGPPALALTVGAPTAPPRG